MGCMAFGTLTHLGPVSEEGIFQNIGSTALPDPPPPQNFAHFPLRPSQQKWAKKHQTLLTGDRWINFRKVSRTGKLLAALITCVTPSGMTVRNSYFTQFPS